MTDLTPVGLTPDGRSLVLVSAQGAEFRVRVDHRLRAALQGEHTRGSRTAGAGGPTRVERTMESTLRPRDIQARIRAGDAAEQVAEAARTSVERIMPYAGPVLAERAHVAQLAQGSSVRRRPGDQGGARTLGEAVTGALREHGLHGDDVAWDAWRREDGRWTLVADYVTHGAPHHATFCFDMRGRYVTAEDEEGRVLVGEAVAAFATEPASPGGRRLSAVPSQDELPLGDDALEMVRGGTPLPFGEDDIADDEPTIEVALPVAEETPTEAEQPQAETPPATEESEAPAAAARSGRRKGRSSVPSWDEIMFGGGRPE
ncbi:MAG: septation protein SepH [Marmoricola sp.]